MAISGPIGAYKRFSTTRKYAILGHVLSPAALSVEEVLAIASAACSQSNCLNIAIKAGDNFPLECTRNTLGITLGTMPHLGEAGAYAIAAIDSLKRIGLKADAAKVIAVVSMYIRKCAVFDATE